MPQLSRLHDAPQLLGAVGEAVGVVDAQQAVGLAGGLHHGSGLAGVERQRFLAEDGEPPLQRRQGLRRVEGVGGGDDDAVEPQLLRPLDQAVEIGEAGRLWMGLPRLRQAFGGRLADGRDLGGPGLGQGVETHPPDPAEADEAQPRRAQACASGITTDFRNPSGRSSEVAKARLISASGKVWVISGSRSSPPSASSRTPSSIPRL